MPASMLNECQCTNAQKERPQEETAAAAALVVRGSPIVYTRILHGPAAVETIAGVTVNPVGIRSNNPFYQRLVLRGTFVPSACSDVVHGRGDRCAWRRCQAQQLYTARCSARRGTSNQQPAKALPLDTHTHKNNNNTITTRVCACVRVCVCACVGGWTDSMAVLCTHLYPTRSKAKTPSRLLHGTWQQRLSRPPTPRAGCGASRTGFCRQPQY